MVRKNIFEIPPCAKPFPDLLIHFKKGRIFALNYKFSNKNDLVCAWRNFKKNLCGIWNETGIKYSNWTSKMILPQRTCCCCNKDRWWSFWHFARKTVFGCLLRAARHTKLCLISLKNILLIVLLVVRVEIDRQHHGQTIHPTQKFISMKFIQPLASEKSLKRFLVI